MALERYAELLFKERFEVRLAEETEAVPVQLLLLVAIDVSVQLLVLIVEVDCDRLAVWVSCTILPQADAILPQDAGVLLELLNSFVLTCQWAAHTTQPTLDMELTLLVIVNRCALNLAVCDELCDILVSPLKNRIDCFDVFLLAAIEAAL